MRTLEIPRPDDWHLHLRDGAALRAVLPHTARRFGRAIVMPNLRPPVATTAQALEYRERILAALPPGARFEPLMTLYLTDQTAPEEVLRARACAVVHGVKLYPAGATTHSDAGVTALARVEPVLEAMEDCGMPLLVHAEVTDPNVDVFDREAAFLYGQLAPLLERFTRLRVVVEHVTTREAVDFVRAAGDRVAATITAHHLLLSRNAMFAGGLRPHAYCLPVLKRERHREALVEAATGGGPRFFLGTDSAPHGRAAQEAGGGWARRLTPPPAVGRRGRRPAAPAPPPPTRRPSCTPRCSRPRARSTASRASPRSTGRASTGCRSAASACAWSSRRGRCPRVIRWATTWSCRCGRASGCCGAWRTERGLDGARSPLLPCAAHAHLHPRSHGSGRSRAAAPGAARVAWFAAGAVREP